MEHEREEDAVVKEGTTEELSDLLGDDSSVAELCAAAHPANQSTESPQSRELILQQQSPPEKDKVHNRRLSSIMDSPVRKKPPPPQPRDEEEYFDPWADDENEEEPPTDTALAADTINDANNDSQSPSQSPRQSSAVDQSALTSAIEEYMEEWDMEGDEFQEVLELGKDNQNSHAAFGATQQAAPISRKRAAPDVSSSSTEPTKKPKPSGDPNALRQQQWNSMLQLLLKYQEEQKHLSPLPTQVFRGMPLGKWVQEQREMFQRRNLVTGSYKALIERRIRELERIGFPWEIATSSRNKRIPTQSLSSHKRGSWDTMLEQLKLFHQQHGHWQPEKSEIFRGYKLGAWVHENERTYERRRSGKMNAAFGKLADERFAKMRAIGFEFGKDRPKVASMPESSPTIHSQQTNVAQAEDENETDDVDLKAVKGSSTTIDETSPNPPPIEANDENTLDQNLSPSQDISVDADISLPNNREIWKHIDVTKTENGLFKQSCKYCGKDCITASLNTSVWAVHIVDPTKGCPDCPLAMREAVAASTKSADVAKARERLGKLPKYKRTIFPAHVTCDCEEDGFIHQRCKYCDTERKDRETNLIFWLVHLVDITKCPKCPSWLRQELAVISKPKKVQVSPQPRPHLNAKVANIQGSIQIPKQSPEKLNAVTQNHIFIDESDNGFKIQSCKYCDKSWKLPKLSPTLWAMHLLDPNKCRECPNEVRRNLILDLDGTAKRYDEATVQGKAESTPALLSETSHALTQQKQAASEAKEKTGDLAVELKSNQNPTSLMAVHEFIDVAKGSNSGMQRQTCKYCFRTLESKNFRTKLWIKHFADPVNEYGCSECPAEVRNGMFSHKHKVAESNQSLAAFQGQAGESDDSLTEKRAPSANDKKVAARPSTKRPPPPQLVPPAPFMAPPYPANPMTNGFPMPWYPNNAFPVPPSHAIHPPPLIPPPQRRKLPDFIHPERYMDI